MSTTQRYTAALAVGLFLSAPPSASAQASAASGPAAVPTVLIMQATTLPEPGGRVVIIRQRTGSPRDIIVLPARGATPADLASALAVLARVRERDTGELPHPQQRISITSSALAAGQSQATEQYFQAILDRLARSPAVTVAGVASGRALVVLQSRLTPG